MNFINASKTLLLCIYFSKISNFTLFKNCKLNLIYFKNKLDQLNDQKYFTLKIFK